MKHAAVITKAPVFSGKRSVPDGAYCGNGDIGLVLGSYDGGLRIYISKCDIRYAVERPGKGGLKPLGSIDVPVPENLYAHYYAEQDMDRCEIRCRFADGEDECTVALRPDLTENSVTLEIGGNRAAEPRLTVFEGVTDGEKGETEEDGIKGIFRRFAGEETVYETHVFAFMKKTAEGRYYAFIATNHDTEDPRAFALGKVRDVTEEKRAEILSAHYKKWEETVSRSSVSIADETLELGWYASQYFIAGCTGNKRFPPGLYGNFVTVEDPSWQSDYHLNYNYQAPFYAACSSNHVEFTDCYAAPLEEFFERGKEFAAKWNCGGILYPVAISPKAVLTEYDPANPLWFRRLFLGQKSNAIHPADIMVFRWKATKDPEYARLHAYPYIKACLAFFEDWMIFEHGRYSVPQDAAHEVPYYRSDFTEKKYRRYINDKNNCLTLGMLRMCLSAAAEMAECLGVDEDKVTQWKQIEKALSPFPTCIRKGRRVFRYTEKGQRWNDGNDVGQQHIYPASCVGELTSDKKTLQIARNTFRQKEKTGYTDNNAVCSFFPMAARLGKDPRVIIRKLHLLTEKAMLPNMLFDFAGGGLENCPVFAATINEMVMQSFEGIVRVFPCWDKKTDIAFNSLRADGAFLVSSEMKNGNIPFVTVKSEAGQTLKLLNPYPKARVSTENGSFVTAERIIELKTQKGNIITIKGEQS